MKTSIELKNMRFFAYHGVLPQDRIIGNDFLANVKMQGGSLYRETVSEYE